MSNTANKKKKTQCDWCLLMWFLMIRFCDEQTGGLALTHPH